LDCNNIYLSKSPFQQFSIELNYINK